MRAARSLAAVAAAGAALAAQPDRARADEVILVESTDASFLYLSPWDSAQPMFSLGLQFLAADDDVDFGLAAALGKSYWGDLDAAGMASVGPRIRIHGDSDDWDSFIVFQCTFGASYHHIWALGVPAGVEPPARAAYVTRSGFGVTAGAGFTMYVDWFYFDMLVHGDAALLWPEASWMAGGGATISMGVRLD